MKMNDIRIAYWPNSKDLTPPGDRRRFVFYARERGLKFELADLNQEYDVVYLTSGCSCTDWVAYKKRFPGTKIIFEIIDSYLLEDFTLFNLLRGPARFISGKDKTLYLDYRKAFLKIISIADAVICSTDIQQALIMRYNKNVHISLDYFSDDITHHKTEYTSSEKLKLVWEGQSYTVKNLLVMNNAFKALKDEVELHIITDAEIKYPLKIFDRKTKDVLKGLQCDYTIHEWRRDTFSRIIASSDLAIIPIKQNDKIMLNKPENKLLLLWEIGMPVFTSPTPAYNRVMTNAKVDGLCASDAEWISKIRAFRNRSTEEKKEFTSNANAYLRAHHTKEVILKKWDRILESVLTTDFVHQK